MSKEAPVADPDLSEFLKLSRPKRRPCVIGLALNTLPPAQAAQLRAALAQDQGVITNAAIEGWLAARDVKTHAQTVLSHRRGKCSCNDA